MKVHYQVKTGRYHITKGEECEDRCSTTEIGRLQVIVLSDGASACQASGRGAELAVAAVFDFFRREYSQCMSYSEEKIAYLLLEHILFYIEEECKSSEIDFHEYGSTVAVACVDTKNNDVILINLGDGEILSFSVEGVHELLLPKRYKMLPCLTTTKGAHDAIEVKKTSIDYGEGILLCSDGFLSYFNRRDKRRLMREALQTNDYSRLDSLLEGSCIDDDSSYISIRYSR